MPVGIDVNCGGLLVDVTGTAGTVNVWSTVYPCKSSTRMVKVCSANVAEVQVSVWPLKSITPGSTSGEINE